MDELRDQVRERPKATLNEGTLRINVEIKLNRGLTHEMVGARVTINSMQTKKRSNLGGTWKNT